MAQLDTMAWAAAHDDAASQDGTATRDGAARHDDAASQDGAATRDGAAAHGWKRVWVYLTSSMIPLSLSL